MKPMSRFTGCIAAEERRIELFELVANQRALANQSGARTTRELPVTDFLDRFVTNLRKVASLAPGWRGKQVDDPTLVS
jgi:hypothetical protein